MVKHGRCHGLGAPPRRRDSGGRLSSQNTVTCIRARHTRVGLFIHPHLTLATSTRSNFHHHRPLKPTKQIKDRAENATWTMLRVARPWRTAAAAA
eukprot:3019189-Rhodomonas_salina.1